MAHNVRSKETALMVLRLARMRHAMRRGLQRSTEWIREEEPALVAQLQADGVDVEEALMDLKAVATIATSKP